MPAPGSGLCLEYGVDGQKSVEVETESQMEVRDSGSVVRVGRRRSFDLRLLSHVLIFCICILTFANSKNLSHIPQFTFIKMLFHELPTAMNLPNEVCYTNLQSYS